MKNLIDLDQMRENCIWSNTEYSDHCNTHKCKSCKYYKSETEYCLPYCEVIEQEIKDRMNTEEELLRWLHQI